jgi:hypothetical protein
MVQYKFIFYKIYFIMYFFLNDIYINISNLEIIKNIMNYKFIIHDMNFFLEKKNSLGFFHLKHPIIFKFNYKNFIYFNNFCLLNLFKIKV